MSRRPAINDEDDDGFSAKYSGPEKRAEKSRKELLGVTGPRVPKAKARQQAAQAAQEQLAAQEQQEADRYRNARVTGDAYEHDPYADNPLRRAEQKELEYLAVKKSKEVTSDLRNVLKITEDTKGVGAQTLVTLKEQGEQIARTHEKAVQMDQELKKGETLLGKLGPMFSFGWKPKKGKTITGPTYRPDMSNPAGDPSSRGELFNGEEGTSKASRSAQKKHGNYLDAVEDETQEQDDILDEVSKNLSHLKNMAMEMGSEVGRQDKALDDLAVDVDELKKRQTQANQRGRRILGRR